MNYLLIGLLVGVFVDFFWVWPKRKGKIPISIHAFGYHFHHSVFGLFVFIIGLLIRNDLLIGLGLGIVASHTFRTKEFTFVHKIKGGKK